MASSGNAYEKVGNFFNTVSRSLLVNETGIFRCVSSLQISSSFCFIFFQCRACVVANDRLFVIGGQEGDFMAKPGSPIFKCSRRNEVSLVAYLA